MANNNTSNGKILVVDDDKNICELLRLYIEKDGFQVVIANDGKRALEMFRAEQPDLIMLDIMLPELDGWQVCREIRRISNIPIILANRLFFIEKTSLPAYSKLAKTCYIYLN